MIYTHCVHIVAEENTREVGDVAFEDMCICISKGHSARMLQKMIDATFNVDQLTLALDS